MSDAPDVAARLAAVTQHLSSQQFHNGPITPWVLSELLAIREAMNAPPPPQNGGKADAPKHKSHG
jgi:hypothetical protein